MYLKIKFTNEINSIEKEVWEFILMNDVLYLDDYKLKNESGILKQYDHLDHTNYSPIEKISKHDVPLTKVIKKQAIAAIFDKIKVKLWDK